MAFGLVGLLVTLGVIIMIFHYIEAPTIKQAVQTKKKVEAQFESNTSEGLADAQASINLDDIERGGHFYGLNVKSIVPGGPMQVDFGLAPGDTIIAIGGVSVRDNNDPDLARAPLFEANVRRQPLTVERGGLPVELRPR